MSSSVSAFINSQNPFPSISSSVPTSGSSDVFDCHRQRPNSFRCIPKLPALTRICLLNSMSPVRANRAAPLDFQGTRLRSVSRITEKETIECSLLQIHPSKRTLAGFYQLDSFTSESFLPLPIFIFLRQSHNS